MSPVDERAIRNEAATEQQSDGGVESHKTSSNDVGLKGQDVHFKRPVGLDDCLKV